MSQVKNDLFYTKDHEWAKVENDIATIGITDHAQGALGDVVFVDLPQVGRTLKQGETFGVVESIKAVSDLYAPCDGVVTEVNSGAQAEPSLLNNDPYGAAWLIKVKVTKPESIRSSLLSADDYTKLV